MDTDRGRMQTQALYTMLKRGQKTIKNGEKLNLLPSLIGIHAGHLQKMIYHEGVKHCWILEKFMLFWSIFRDTLKTFKQAYVHVKHKVLCASLIDHG